jgi:uncharacterized protein (TIGR02118 family)
MFARERGQALRFSRILDHEKLATRGGRMYWATVLYPKKEGARFDFDYYLHKHIPMAAKLFGPGIQVVKGVASAAGAPAFLCVCRIPAKSVEEFLAVMSGPGAALMADIPNYTNIEPVVQFDEVLL